MLGRPENSCLMCDMPWKNNQVRYEGGPPCACAGGPEGAAACLCLGQVQVRAMPNGDIYVDGQGENLCHHTRQPIQRGTMAADVASHTLYFASGCQLRALDLEKGSLRWNSALEARANSPMLFELLERDGGVRLLLAATDVEGRVYALDRESGQRLWRSETGFACRSVPAHRDGRLFVSCKGVTACLDASTGDAIWARPGGGGGGLLLEDCYLSGGERLSLVDGSPV